MQCKSQLCWSYIPCAARKTMGISVIKTIADIITNISNTRHKSLSVWIQVEIKRLRKSSRLLFCCCSFGFFLKLEIEACPWGKQEADPSRGKETSQCHCWAPKEQKKAPDQDNSAGCTLQDSSEWSTDGSCSRATKHWALGLFFRAV